ncbi:MAG: hypothetical protein VXW32_09740, partial [Myxococcota bacterium]|nr:hypothetical protein [Myxococcota bacterium]
MDWGLYGSRHGRHFAPGLICELRMEGVAEGRVMSVPWMPEELISDQSAAVEAMAQAVEALGSVDAVGLGSLLAVVGSRGQALAGRTSIPVTSGAAATTWAALQNTLRVLERSGQNRVALVGFSGTVGEALATALTQTGVSVTVGGVGSALNRRATGLGMQMVSVEEAVRTHSIVVGAGTTGEVIDPRWLRPHSLLLDVALPSSLKKGPRPKGLLVLAAEAMELPEGWSRGFWGHVYHLLAGYGPRQIFACLAEPMVMAAQGRTQPYAQGRRLPIEQVHAFGAAAQEMGLQARLARGWKALDEA